MKYCLKAKPKEQTEMKMNKQNIYIYILSKGLLNSNYVAVNEL